MASKTATMARADSATPSALTSPRALLARHAAGDWGAVPAEDAAAENEFSVGHGFRIIFNSVIAGSRCGL